MKKFVSVLSVLVITAFVVACGNSSNNLTSGTFPGSPTTVADPASAPLTKLGGSIQGTALVTFNNVSTVAGIAGIPGFANYSANTAAKFNRPTGITTDGKYLYVADFYNHLIRQIEIATGKVTTLAGLAGIAGYTDGSTDGANGIKPTFNFPNAITTDGTNLYVTDSASYTIRKLTRPFGDSTVWTVSTLSGSAFNPGSIDGTGNIVGVVGTARFNQLNGITTDGNYLYVSDSNNSIRWVDKNSGEVRTLAGSAGSVGTTDGIGTTARFNLPARITCDGPNLYVCDFNNRTVRKINIKTAAVSTIAGNASSTPGTTDLGGIIGITALFNQPNGITTDGTNLYVTDSYNNTISKISLTAPYAVNKIAGITYISGKTGSPGHVDSAAGTSSFDTPIGITTDGTSLFVTDSNNHTIRKIR